MAAISSSNRAEPSATRPLPARRGWSQPSPRVGRRRHRPPRHDEPSCHSGARGRSRSLPVNGGRNMPRYYAVGGDEAIEEVDGHLGNGHRRACMFG